MDFKLTDEQELLLEGLREILAREMPESYIEECYEKEEFPYRLAKVLADHGYNLLGVSEEYGGIEADVLTQVLVAQEIAKAGGPYNDFIYAMTIDDIMTYGNGKQKRLAIEVAKKGIPPLALGITEPQAGSDDNAISTSATRKNGKVYINGHKTFCSLAGVTPYMLCFTKDSDVSDPYKAISMWWVAMDLPGIKMEKIPKIGLFSNGTYEVYLNNVEIEESDLVGREGYGFIQLMKNFEVERLLLAGGCLGWAECAYQDAARYANKRVQFGKLIGSFQLIQQKITNMAVNIENMRNMLYKACWEKDNEIPAQISSAMCKYYCARASFEVIDDAMQIMGGIGYTKAHRISRLWKDSRVNRIGGGTDEIMIHILGRALLKKI